MNPIDRIHHDEHRTTSRGSARFERAWDGGTRTTTLGGAGRIATADEPRPSPDDYAD